MVGQELYVMVFPEPYPWLKMENTGEISRKLVF
jgi:hypothetical protein